MPLNPVPHHHRQMLVTTQMHRSRLSQQPQRVPPTGLRPAIAVEVGEQPADLQPFDARAYARSVVGLAE